MRNYLTIDVEDYYQVSAFEPIVGAEKWDQYPSRVVENTRRLLEVLDRHGVTATFFVLGWIGERHPGLVKDITERGHFVACHSHQHRLIYELTPKKFKKDTRRAKDVLEQIIGKRVVGYRAPSYSITRQSWWAYDILSDLGFEYSSSVFPIHHDRYGIPNAPRFRFNVPGHDLVEYPISTVRFLGQNMPVSGGGYFRIFPYWLTKMGLSRINKVDRQPFVFFVHPWETDPEQPRMRRANAVSKFRHYTHLRKTLGRFEKLLNDFQFIPILKHKIRQNNWVKIIKIILIIL
ncbi:MAG: XrtA system polysaccharide deacetylase [Deltaproteobacteria bacterium]|nr:XrtA system polysaccharide deacetylase [Deltaproteobacteria bacterium]